MQAAQEAGAWHRREIMGLLVPGQFAEEPPEVLPPPADPLQELAPTPEDAQLLPQ